MPTTPTSSSATTCSSSRPRSSRSPPARSTASSAQRSARPLVGPVAVLAEFPARAPLGAAPLAARRPQPKDRLEQQDREPPPPPHPADLDRGSQRRRDHPADDDRDA